MFLWCFFFFQNSHFSGRYKNEKFSCYGVFFTQISYFYNICYLSGRHNLLLKQLTGKKLEFSCRVIFLKNYRHLLKQRKYKWKTHRASNSVTKIIFHKKNINIYHRFLNSSALKRFRNQIYHILKPQVNWFIFFYKHRFLHFYVLIYNLIW
jgi:hypothetical protein